MCVELCNEPKNSPPETFYMSDVFEGWGTRIALPKNPLIFINQKTTRNSRIVRKEQQGVWSTEG